MPWPYVFRPPPPPTQPTYRVTAPLAPPPPPPDPPPGPPPAHWPVVAFFPDPDDTVQRHYAGLRQRRVLPPEPPVTSPQRPWPVAAFFPPDHVAAFYGPARLAAEQPRRVLAPLSPVEAPLLWVECNFTANPGDPASTGSWTDLSGRVRGLHLRRGRQYELARTEAGTLDIELKNNDGALDPTNTTSPYHPNVLPNRQIRVRAAWQGQEYALFWGFVERWPQRWDGGGRVGWSDLVAVDAWKVLANIKLRGAYDKEVLDDNPIGYYTLGEPQDATQFGSIATTQQPLATVVASKYGGATVAAAAGGIVASSAASCVAFSGADGAAKVGSVIQLAADGYGPYTTNQAGTGWSVELWFQASAPVTDLGLLWSQVASNTGGALVGNGNIKLNTNGTLTVTPVDAGGTTPASPRYDDNTPHHVVFGFAADGRTWTLYVDGTQVLSGVNASVFGSNTPRPGWSLVGGLLTSGAQQQFLGTGATVRVQAVAVYPAMLPASRVQAHHTAGAAGFAGETSGARVQRILRYAGWTGGQAVDTGLSTMASASDFAGKTALDALHDVADAELGIVFMSGANQVVFKARSARYNAPVAATFGDPPGQVAGELPYTADARVDFDETFIRNLVTVTRPGGVQVAAFDQPSRDRYFDRTLDEQPRIATDAEATDRANYQLGRFKDPHQRLERITVRPARDPARLWPVVLGTVFGDRWTVNRRPPAPATTVALDVFTEAVEHTIPLQRNDWTATFQLSPADTETYWIVGDPTLGVVGVTTIPAY